MSMLSPSYPPDEVAIRVAAKLYEARDAAKSLFRDDYREKIKPYTMLVEQVAGQRDIPILRAGKLLAADDEISGMTKLLILAATVELIEPTP